MRRFGSPDGNLICNLLVDKRSISNLGAFYTGEESGEKWPGILTALFCEREIKADHP